MFDKSDNTALSLILDSFHFDFALLMTAVPRYLLSQQVPVLHF
jgi:hypothetical protein